MERKVGLGCNLYKLSIVLYDMAIETIDDPFQSFDEEIHFSAGSNHPITEEGGVTFTLSFPPQLLQDYLTLYPDYNRSDLFAPKALEEVDIDPRLDLIEFGEKVYEKAIKGAFQGDFIYNFSREDLKEYEIYSILSVWGDEETLHVEYGLDDPL